MAIKDWEHIGNLLWQKGRQKLRVHTTEPYEAKKEWYVWVVIAKLHPTQFSKAIISVKKTFKTKPQALTFAEDYMKKN
jgi:hypothetical protein